MLYEVITYIHLCFDVQGMELLQKECDEKGFPFTVNSADSFDMGVAAGHFSYISDPDGTPIEFVETHKLPIIEKLGWYMNLKGRDPEKSLPNCVITSYSIHYTKLYDPLRYPKSSCPQVSGIIGSGWLTS